MGRSLSFGSNPLNLVALIRTRFRYGSEHDALNLALKIDSPDHYAKGTQSAITLAGHRPPTACKFAVSGSISLPFLGSFQLSFTVLVHYRLPASI